MNPRGEVCTGQSLPPDSELTRFGNSWHVIGTAGTPDLFFPPSGSVLLKCWNVGPDYGPSIVVDAVGIRVNALPTTPVATVLNISVALRARWPLGAGSNTPASGLALATRTSLTGRKQYRGIAAISGAAAINGHISSTDWHVVGSVICANTNILHLQKYVPVYGRYIVPPGGIFALHASMSLGTESGSSVFGQIWWHEVQLPNESGMGRGQY
jgi:hypothetical protein